MISLPEFIPRIIKPPTELPPLPSVPLPCKFEDIIKHPDLNIWVSHPTPHSKALLLASCFGNILLYYPPDLNPHPPFGVSSTSPYFIWSSGGGSGCPSSYDQAAASFLQRAKFFYDLWTKDILNQSIEFIFPDYSCYRDAGSVLKNQPAPAFQGFGGSMWYLRSLNDGSIVKTNNLWHKGELPLEFRHLLPPTHEPIHQPLNPDLIPYNQPKSTKPSLSPEQSHIVEH